MTIRHLRQEKPYSCGAACLAMVLGLPEAMARELAGTRRSGTHMHRLHEPIRAAGHLTYSVPAGCDLTAIVDNLVAQSARWPLILSCTFKQTAVDARLNLRTKRREHAIVVWHGLAYDPGLPDPIDLECMGHVGDRGIFVSSYILVEPKQT